MCNLDRVAELVYAALTQHPELTAAGLRVYDARLRAPEAEQPEIAEAVGLSVRQVRRCEKRLCELDLITIERIYDRDRQRTSNVYGFPEYDQPDKSVLPPSDSPDKSVLSPSDSPDKSVLSPSDSPDKSVLSSEAKMASDASHDQPDKFVRHDSDSDSLNHESDKESIMSTLDFLGKTLTRATKKHPVPVIDLPHMTAEYAEEAAEWFYGGYSDSGGRPVGNRIGYVLTFLRNGDPFPFVKQFELPESTLQAEGLLVDEVTGNPAWFSEADLQFIEM